MDVKRMFEDDRPITAAWVLGNEGDASWVVGKNGVTRIVPYHENGDMAPVPWLAVYRGEECVVRLRGGSLTSIHYTEDL